ncbi:ATP-binding cassette domain-containing protein [Alicyclobacillus sp. ALC3]|nr:ATP-binding cassette domain-containing protein [Alicyclobacillus sp. ALC3]
MAVGEGEFVSLIGPNGAGKTTLINAMSGTLRPLAGRVLYDGVDITNWKADARARAGIGRSFQRTNLFPDLDALGNVKLAVLGARGVKLRQALRRTPEDVWERSEQALAAVGLSKLAQTPASALSHGDKRKLELAMLLALAPRVILLDEPTAGLSLAEAPQILDLIHQLKDSGRYAMVLVEHKMEVVMRLSNRVAVLHQGTLLTVGSPDEVMANPEVEAAYLGGRHDTTA